MPTARNNQNMRKIQLPYKIPVGDVDLCTLVGNLLENVIKGCNTVTDSPKYHDLSVSVEKEKNLYIVSTNNFDGKINALDISKLRYTVTLTGAMSSLEQRTAKDINGDGSINVADLVLLQSFILGKDSDSLAGTIVTIEQ